MTIGIAAEHANTANPTGVEHYCRQLICALSRLDKENDYKLYLRTDPRPWIIRLPRNFTYKVIRSRIAWTQIGVSWEILRRRPDALLVPSFSMPLIHPNNSIVTIHDLAWHIFPETHLRKQRLWLTFTHRFAACFAKRLIAVSHQTKQDLSNRLGVPVSKIDVIYHGFSRETDQPDAEAADLASESSRISTVPKPFVLCLGTLQPRKNIIRVIDAFLDAKVKAGFPHSLVIAGRKGWRYEEITRKIDASPGVIYFGYVLDRFALLRASSLLVQGAIYEGFGLSLLDAFSEGIPVACSNISSLPEVAGGAAALFNPYDVDNISAVLQRVLTDISYAAALSAKGAARISSFTWDECARRTLESLYRIN
jgi:glycosyltransferase involved in cell wall biosynthesis